MASNETTSRPRGRRPGHDDTRGTILATATRLFQQTGYDKVSLRAVAREADVDPALVHHYFGSKADLFTSGVLGVSWNPASSVADILDGPEELVGRRAARLTMELQDMAGGGDYLSEPTPTRPTGSAALTEMVAREVFAPVAEHFGHDNAILRAQLSATTLMGFRIGRTKLQLPALTRASRRSLVAPLGHVLQHYLVDAW